MIINNHTKMMKKLQLIKPGFVRLVWQNLDNAKFSLSRDLCKAGKANYEGAGGE